MTASGDTRAERARLEALVPHRGPMLLLDALVAHGQDFAECRVDITADSRFVVEGHVPAVVALEYMAQCVAVVAGLRGDGEPQVGYLVGVRALNLAVDALGVGDSLRVHAKLVWNNAVSGSFDARVTRGGEAVADATLSVFIPSAGDRSP